MVRKGIVLLLCLSLLMSSSVMAQEIAVDGENVPYVDGIPDDYNDASGEMDIQPYYSYTATTDTGMCIINKNIGVGTASILGYADEVIKITGYMYLQKVNSNGTYQNITSWYSEVDGWDLDMENTHTLTSSGTYRIMMVYNVYHRPMQYEVVQTYSNEVTFVK